MPKLFLLAPHSKTQPGTHHKDFYTIVANGGGPDYGISESHPANHNRNAGRRLRSGRGAASGRQRERVCADYQGWQRRAALRCDIRGLTLRPYTSPPRVDRFGVGV